MHTLQLITETRNHAEDSCANVFCSTFWPGAPLGLGAPGFARSESLVVTPLRTAIISKHCFQHEVLETLWLPW